MPHDLIGERLDNDSSTFAYKVESYYKTRKDGKPGRVITLFFSPMINSPAVTVIYKDHKEVAAEASRTLVSKLEVLLSENVGVKSSAAIEMIVQTDKNIFRKSAAVPAERYWTVFIYPHSHVDIGYTGLQEEVAKIHYRNIDVGIDLAKKTRNYPEGSQFIWNTEAAWVASGYLKNAAKEQKKTFIEAVKRGWVQLDAGHSNINTSVCSDEELMRFFRNGNELEEKTGVPITSLVQVDVPGAAWGIVPAASQNGVTGFISFPNYYDVRKIWEHKPFYWKGPDGKSKILFLQGYPYGIGYTIKGSKYGLATLQTYSEKYDRVSTGRPLENFVDKFLFKETAVLEREKSPYDFFVMTWSMADNCVIDADLPEAVKEWNMTYSYPKLKIAGAKTILAKYEEKYGSIIPSFSGDFTEFWTNGLGAAAAHVGMGRRAKENLVAAETLSALLGSSAYSTVKADSAWENLLLSAEHTWGYQNPKEPFAKVIEGKKKSYFSESEKQSDALLKGFSERGDDAGEQYSIVNTLSWGRAGIVTLSAEQSRGGNGVLDAESGEMMLSQRLSNGELIFQTKTIPALASKLYKVVKGNSSRKSFLEASASSLKNGLLSVTVDGQSGAIKSIIDQASKHEFAEAEGLNAYYYLPGVFNGKDSVSNPVGVESSEVTVKEKGALLVSLLIQSKACGVHWMQREIKLFANTSSIHIANAFDKVGTGKKEGIHFGFAFRLPEAIARVDAPWSVIVPEKDQLKGANRNWMTFQRWIDISNDNFGVTWTAIESPLMEWGEMSGVILDGARQFSLWKKALKPSSAFYSWPLNNHWDTNFPLEQSGLITQQYAALFHGKREEGIVFRFGMEQHRPLIAVKSKENLIENSFLNVSNPKVIVSLLKKGVNKNTFLVRLRSFSPLPEKTDITSTAKRIQKIQSCARDEIPDGTIVSKIPILPYGTKTLLLTIKDKESK